MKVRAEASAVVERLFDHFAADVTPMPASWATRAAAAGGDEARRLRVVADYIAGMTDRYALSEHRRLFGGAPRITIAFE